MSKNTLVLAGSLSMAVALFQSKNLDRGDKSASDTFSKMKGE